MTVDLDQLRESGRDHELVANTLRSLQPQPDQTFAPPADLHEQVAARLAGLQDHTELLAAVFGLLELAAFLHQQRSVSAANAIYEGLADSKERLTQALRALGFTEDAIAALTASAFESGGSGDGSKFEPRREPKAGELKAGPFARFAKLPGDP